MQCSLRIEGRPQDSLRPMNSKKVIFDDSPSDLSLELSTSDAALLSASFSPRAHIDRHFQSNPSTSSYSYLKELRELSKKGDDLTKDNVQGSSEVFLEAADKIQAVGSMIDDAKSALNDVEEILGAMREVDWFADKELWGDSGQRRMNNDGELDEGDDSCTSSDDDSLDARKASADDINTGPIIEEEVDGWLCDAGLVVLEDVETGRLREATDGILKFLKLAEETQYKTKRAKDIGA